MPRRGSAQLLLLFSRPRLRLGRTMRAIAGTAFAALLLSGAGLSRSAPSELAHLVQKSAWERALAGSPEHTPWPWNAAPDASRAEVPRLGLSASFVQDGRSRDRYAANAEPRQIIGKAWNESMVIPSTMAVGDRITLTTASGDSRVYRVIGRKIVDPHLAESGDAALVTCQPHDSASTLQLVIQSITNDLPAAEPKAQQKL
jgi:hypothetical protein